MRAIKEKEYGLFTPEERFSLTITALARGDFKEADRLWDSCPRHSYRAIDFEYANRVMATTLITLYFFQKCTYHYNLIKMAEHYLLLMSKNEPDRSEQANALKIRGNHITQLKALYEGLKLFCEHVGLVSDDFLKKIQLESTLFDIDDYLCESTEPTTDEIENAKNAIFELWLF